jgi:hypothetical protein
MARIRSPFLTGLREKGKHGCFGAPGVGYSVKPNKTTKKFGNLLKKKPPRKKVIHVNGKWVPGTNQYGKPCKVYQYID